jgi:hypothetical protein
MILVAVGGTLLIASIALEFEFGVVVLASDNPSIDERDLQDSHLLAIFTLH